MARWKDLADYSTVARLLVEYMWEHRPPLLPSQFAEQVAMPKQALSRVLNDHADPDPVHLVKIARATPLSLTVLFQAAGYTTPDYPVYDQETAWAMVIDAVQAVPQVGEGTRGLVIDFLVTLHAGLFTPQPERKDAVPSAGRDLIPSAAPEPDDSPDLI